MRAFVIFLIGCGRLGFDDPSTGGTSASAIMVVQTASVLDSPATITLDIAPAQLGDMIVVATAAISAGTPVSGVTDDAGDVFASAGVVDTCFANSTIGELWFANVAVAGATTVSVTGTAADDREVWVLEVAGISELDQTGKIDNAPATNSVIAPTVSPSAYPALIVSDLNDPSHIGDLIAGSVFTALPVLHGDDAAYAIVTTPGDYGAVWANTVTGDYCAFTAAFH